VIPVDLVDVNAAFDTVDYNSLPAALNVTAVQSAAELQIALFLQHVV